VNTAASTRRARPLARSTTGPDLAIGVDDGVGGVLEHEALAHFDGERIVGADQRHEHGPDHVDVADGAPVGENAIALDVIDGRGPPS
jgi:hypothetical protein